MKTAARGRHRPSDETQFIPSGFPSSSIENIRFYSYGAKLLKRRTCATVFDPNMCLNKISVCVSLSVSLSHCLLVLGHCGHSGGHSLRGAYSERSFVQTRRYLGTYFLHLDIYLQSFLQVPIDPTPTHTIQML